MSSKTERLVGVAKTIHRELLLFHRGILYLMHQAEAAGSLLLGGYAFSYSRYKYSFAETYVTFQPQKRSFSPNSDDGDLVIPPIADDDTPPPSERPLLRQPVAFAWNNSLPSLATAPVDLNTYQASIPNVASSSNTAFLPGQEVPSSALPAPKTKGSRTKKADGTSAKKRRTVEYSGQTGRFRLNAYDPTPSTSPPLQQGQGPYSSIYRGIAFATDRSFSTASPTLTLSSGGGCGGSVPPTPAPDVSGGSKAPSQPTARRSKQTEARAKPPAAREKSSDANAKSSGKGKGRASSSARKTSAVANNMPSASHNVTPPSPDVIGSGYYRHDYASNMDAQHSPGSSAQSPFSEPGVPAAAQSSVTGEIHTGNSTEDALLTRGIRSRSKTCRATRSHGNTPHSRFTEWSCRPPVSGGENTP